MMWCLKCGKDTKDENVFCPQCLAKMESYPVKPDIHIQLPNHEARELARRNAKKKKRAPTFEEQIESLRTRNRRLMAIIVLLVLMLGAAAYYLLKNSNAPEIVENIGKELGKNYTVETPTE